MMQQRGSRPSAIRRGSRSTGRWCAPEIPAWRWGRLQEKLKIAPSTLSHHIKTLMVAGLIMQKRDATTLVCHANYDVMRGLVDFLVAECCADVSEASCKDTSKDTKSAA